jgi:hypothetical protein
MYTFWKVTLGVKLRSNANNNELMENRVAHLLARYGELLTLTELADVLKYPSRQALTQARRRGLLPVGLVRIPKRRGWFASTRRVAAFLDEIESGTAAAGPQSGEENAMS